MIDRLAWGYPPAMSLRSILVLGLGLCTVLNLTACDAEPGETDTDADAETETGETGGEPNGACVEFTALDLIVAVTVDGETKIPTLSGTCELSDMSFADASLSLSLSCVDALQVAHAVEISAPAEQIPTGLEIGASLGIELQQDGSDEFGDGAQVLIRDAAGPLLAQIDSSNDGATWGPISVRYASYCAPSDPESVETRYGYVRAEVEGVDEPYEVFVGAPQIISDGQLEWDLHALNAKDICCHGSTIDAALIRR